MAGREEYHVTCSFVSPHFFFGTEHSSMYHRSARGERDQASNFLFLFFAWSIATCRRQCFLFLLSRVPLESYTVRTLSASPPPPSLTEDYTRSKPNPQVSRVTQKKRTIKKKVVMLELTICIYFLPLTNPASTRRLPQHINEQHPPPVCKGKIGFAGDYPAFNTELTHSPTSLPSTPLL
jgi:hypothetical protein